jgi:hypothetical protein
MKLEDIKIDGNWAYAFDNNIKVAMRYGLFFLPNLINIGY